MAKQTPCAKLKGSRRLISNILDVESWDTPHYLEYCREKSIKKRVNLHTTQRKRIDAHSFALNPKSIISTCPSALRVYVVPANTEISNSLDDFHVTKKFIANAVAEEKSLCIVNRAMNGFCVQFKAKFLPGEKDIIDWSQNKKKKSTVAIALMRQYKHTNPGNPLHRFLLNVAKSICSVDLNARTKRLYPTKPRKGKTPPWKMTRLQFTHYAYSRQRYNEMLKLVGGDTGKLFRFVSDRYYHQICDALIEKKDIPTTIIKKELQYLLIKCPELKPYLRANYPEAFEK